LPRLLILFLVFAAELVAISLSVDGQNLVSSPLLTAQVLGVWGMPAIRFLVSFAVMGCALMYLMRREALNTFRRDASQSPTQPRRVLLHLTLFGALMLLGPRLYAVNGAKSAALPVAFVLLGIGVLFTGLAALAPVRIWLRLAKSAGATWLYAAIPALATVLLSAAWRSLWKPASLATFTLVQWMLRPFLGHLIIQPDRMRIATARFGVIISPQCSGLEGMGLLILFGSLWLWLNRKEFRFPHALLFIPVGLVTLFVLNSVRIAALMLIGNAGARDIAANGFHSQAGWIAFNGVAFGLCLVSGRVSWMVRTAQQPDQAIAGTQVPELVNNVAVYLGPFLAILAAGMLARSLTGGFEWLYPLRIAAAAAVLFSYLPEYRAMNWTWTWRGPAGGLVVFAAWIAMEFALSGQPAGAAPSALQFAAPTARWTWIAARAFTAILAVPLAEELAFRGYLLRRLTTSDFGHLNPARSTVLALAGSSVLFGVMHGERWLAGTLAGILYSLLYRRKGQLGDAILAHATTNAAIAAAVLLFGWWKLW